MTDRCSDPRCYDGKVPVDQGEGLAPCPRCERAALEAENERLQQFEEFWYDTKFPVIEEAKE